MSALTNHAKAKHPELCTEDSRTESFVCVICFRKYGSKGALKTHVGNKHEDHYSSYRFPPKGAG